jgi:hypothetical protein
MKLRAIEASAPPRTLVHLVHPVHAVHFVIRQP